MTHSLVGLCSRHHRRGKFTCDPSDFLRQRLRTSFVCRSAPSRDGTATSIGRSVRQSVPVSHLMYKSINFNGARITVHTTFGTMTSGGRMTMLIPAAILTCRRFRAFHSHLGKLPYQMRCLDHTHATTRTGTMVGKLRTKSIGVLVNARHVLKGSIGFGSLKLLVVSRRRGFNISIGRGLQRVGIGISALAVATAPVPHALRFSLVKTHSLDIVSAPPPGHCPVRARMRAFDRRIVTSTVGFRVDHGKRIFLMGGHVTGLPRLGTVVLHRVPSYQVTVKRKRVRPTRLRRVVFNFIGCSCSMLVTAAVVRDKVSVPGTGAVVVGRTRGFKLDSLRRVHKHIKHDGGGTFYCLLTPPLSSLAPRTGHHLRTVRGFDSLNDNVRVTVRSLSVHNTNGVLKTRRDKFVTSLNCRACRGVLSRTIRRLGASRFTRLCTSRLGKRNIVDNRRFIRRYRIRDSLRLLLPTGCIANDDRHVLLCQRLSKLALSESMSTFHSQLRSHFNPVPPRARRLLHVMPLEHLTTQLKIRGIFLGKKHVALFFIGGTRDPCCRDTTFNGVVSCVVGCAQEYSLERRGKHQSVLMGSVPGIRATIDMLLRVITLPIGRGRWIGYKGEGLSFPLSMWFICRIHPSSTTRFVSSVPSFFQFVPGRGLSLYRLFPLDLNARCQFRYVQVGTYVPDFNNCNRKNENRVLRLFRVRIRLFNSSYRFHRVFFFATQVAKSRVESRLLTRTGFPISSIRCLFGFSRLTRDKFARSARCPIANVFQYGFRTPTSITNC